LNSDRVTVAYKEVESGGELVSRNIQFGKTSHFDSNSFWQKLVQELEEQRDGLPSHVGLSCADQYSSHRENVNRGWLSP